MSAPTTARTTWNTNFSSSTCSPSRRAGSRPSLAASPTPRPSRRDRGHPHRDRRDLRHRLGKVENGRLFDGDGKRVEQYYGFGEDVLAVADGTVVYVHDGMPDETPSVPMVPKSKSDYGGNNVILEITPKVFAWYAHLQQGSLRVKVGDAVQAGAPIAKLGNSGPSEGPHLHFGLLDKPDPIAGRSLPFLFDSFTLDGAVDLDASQGDRLVIRPDARQVRSAYPLYGGIQNYP